MECSQWQSLNEVERQVERLSVILFKIFLLLVMCSSVRKIDYRAKCKEFKAYLKNCFFLLYIPISLPLSFFTHSLQVWVIFYLLICFFKDSSAYITTCFPMYHPLLFIYSNRLTFLCLNFFQFLKDFA